jgi:hypothetical protein
LADLRKKWDANAGHSCVLAERIAELERVLNVTTEEKGYYESTLKEKESILSEKDAVVQQKEGEKASIV